MADLKMPELNSIFITGNLTKDPVFRTTTNGSPVVNFAIAANRKYRDSNSQWQEDVCYIGVVAWNKLAESCNERLKKGNAVLIDGELQSRSWKTDEGHNRSIVEIKARRIQFLNKRERQSDFGPTDGKGAEVPSEGEIPLEDSSFDKFLSNEESELLKGDADKKNDAL